MHSYPTRRAGKFWILGILALLSLTSASCGSDDSPVAPPANRAPGAPTIDTASGAPADHAVDTALNLSLHWNCSDADGDDLTYTVRFGDEATPVPVSTDQSGTSYGPLSMLGGTTFYWQIVAKDPDGETTASPVWSFTTIAPAGETVTTPTTPTGPVTGETAAALSFNTGGATSSLGHAVEYRFDWGGGVMSDWSGTLPVDHSWTTAGSYEVAAQARCATDTAIESLWSAALTVVISDPATETVGTPAAPTGPLTGLVNESLVYSTDAVVSSLGHAVEYVFEWGDGNNSGYMISPANHAHVWLAAGTYDVRVKARCSEHPAIESAWSTVTTVTITQPAETISAAPRTNEATTEFAAVGEDAWVSCTQPTSSLGHALEYRFDLGDGTITAWQADSYLYYAWAAAGTYVIRAQARCSIDTEVITDWSPDEGSASITIHEAGVETISPAVLELGNDTYNTPFVQYRFLVWAHTDQGNDIECRIDWGNGEISDWIAGDDAAAVIYYTYSVSGTFALKAQARSSVNPSTVSPWSDEVSITLDELVTRPTLTGPTTGTVGQELVFVASDAISTSGHALGYQLRVDSTLLPESVDPNLPYTFTAPGSYTVKARAYCLEHGKYSEYSTPPLTVVITD